MKSIVEANLIADEIIGMYQSYGSADYIGEPVSQLEHMCQSAQLAEAANGSEEIILAAFFHDIGHLCEHLMPVEQMDGFGVVDHEKLGADFLRSKGFSETITSLVENHVQAKRYLTYRYPAYFEKLSEASLKTLAFQGGKMSSEEAAYFEQDPLFEWHIQLRKWDEQAKLEQQPIASLNIYREMIIHHLTHSS